MPSSTRPAVLFACVHNAGRSQMAAAYLEHVAHGEIDVRSGGSAPGERINPLAVEVMAELGVDLSKRVPAPLLTADVEASDVVVTMGCGDTCPYFPGKRYEDWVVGDPDGRSLDDVRTIRDDITARVDTLIDSLLR